jgi:hypothetical protein
MPKVAVVTLSIGPKRQDYDRYFLHTIKAYSKKFGFEYIEINETFDIATKCFEVAQPTM